MNETSCPELPHFHIVYEQVGSFQRPTKTVVAATAEDALEAFLPILPDSWRGGVSVFDDSNGHEDEMPLLHHYVTHPMTSESRFVSSDSAGLTILYNPEPKQTDV
jgi:hypothetical protein